MTAHAQEELESIAKRDRQNETTERYLLVPIEDRASDSASHCARVVVKFKVGLS